MKTLHVLVTVIALGAAVLGLTGCSTEHDHSATEHSGHEHGTAAKGQYTCSMHPEVVQNSPGKCPKCGMDLEQKK